MSDFTIYVTENNTTVEVTESVIETNVTVTEVEVAPDVTEVIINISPVEVTIYTGNIPDAPADGKTYGRKDNDWEEVQGGGVTIHGNLSGLDADSQHPLWKTIDGSTVPDGTATADDKIMFWTASGWIYNKLSEFLQGLAGALASFFAPVSHGDANHSETYIKEGDSRLDDARTPLEHGDEAHSETYIKDGDTRLTDARPPLEHGNEAHSEAYITGSDVPANESDPVFSNSEAANFETGDKSKLDSALQAVAVDGVTVTGDGTAGNPLVSTAQPATESTVTLVNTYTGNLAGATTQEGVNQVVDTLPNQADYDYIFWLNSSTY